MCHPSGAYCVLCSICSYHSSHLGNQHTRWWVVETQALVRYAEDKKNNGEKNKNEMYFGKPIENVDWYKNNVEKEQKKREWYEYEGTKKREKKSNNNKKREKKIIIKTNK